MTTEWVAYMQPVISPHVPYQTYQLLPIAACLHRFRTFDVPRDVLRAKTALAATMEASTIVHDNELNAMVSETGYSIQVCEVCNLRAIKIKKCSKCSSGRFCNEQCFANAWPTVPISGP